ncbi:unnamed protein product [Staurois parvus]|uniref:Transposase n=1 Tax=Staurois parvus TaxID=386267 RepID=A0ABN9F1A8_9NEOB|nr:unnamed protein product [Staurois parvus]
MQIKAHLGRFLPDPCVGSREQLLKYHYIAANRYLKLLVPLESHGHQGVLQSLVTVHKPSIWPPLTNAHKQKWLHWAEKYMKTNFQTVLFTDECHATLDGPDGWGSGWLVDGHPIPTRLRRQQGGGGVMFWARIMGTELVGPPLGSPKV